jgi:putative ABC transport system permease protein
MAASFDPSGQQIVYVGIDTNMLALKPGWRIVGTFPKEGQMLAGSRVAEQRGWRQGETAALPGFADVRLPVSGVLLPTQSPDDAFIALPLEDAQRLFRHTNDLTHILVRLSDPNRLDQVVAALRGCNAGMHMNVVPLSHLFQTIQSLVNSTRWFLAGATLIALLAAGAGVTAALLIAVTERTREIGVLRALGASSTDVFRLFWLESLQICLGGGILGVLGVFVLMRSIEHWLRVRLPFTPDGRFMTWDWSTVAACLAAAVVLGTLAGMLPAWRAARLQPIRAIRDRNA